jgi:histidine phosphotransfer protein HptB
MKSKWFLRGVTKVTDHLNAEIFNELKDIMEEEFPLLLETYLRDSQLQYQRIDEAWQNRSMEDLRRNAHSLKGSSANIGAQQLAALCAELEMQAKSSLESGVADTVVAVAAELTAVQQTVNSIYLSCRD